MLRFYDRFQKGKDVADFIGHLAAVSPPLMTAIFLDGATIHTARVVQNKARELGIRLVFNTSHTPMHNGIEYLWG